MSGGKGNAKNGKVDYKLYGIAAVVLAAALAAAGFYGGFFSPAPAQPASGTAALPLATPEARLLLASFDSGAALTDYTLKYSANDNGAKSSYVLVKNGSSSYVGVRGAFGSMEGFFGRDNTTDIVCLAYGGAQKCAVTGNDTGMAEIAASLKILLPTSTAYLNQKDDTRKLISTGAIRLVGGMANETVGAYDTQKISYILDYSNLTVQQMITLGISPSDESLLAITDQNVEFWIDRKTGLMIKSHATYNNRGTPGFYDTEYAEAGPEPSQMPSRPGTIVSTEGFADFYARSTNDYAVRAACFAKSGSGRWACIKNIAVGKGNWEDCKLIEDQNEYEICSLIVAQETHNHLICGELPGLADECYIAVVGETGNLELCKSLGNMSLAQTCAQAAAAGKKELEEAAAEAEKLRAGRNCVDDAGCKTFGNAGQHCAPANTTGDYANETSPLFACLDGVPCGCLEGYCGFAKNES